jgi:hypothetical protein
MIDASQCHRCQRISPPPYTGDAFCLFDPANPVNIRNRLAAGICPEGRFNDPPPPPKLLPGNIVAIMLEKMGYEKGIDCGCAEFREKMNQWGWLGCIWHRREIVDWFQAKSAEVGIVIDRDGIWGLFEAAWTEYRRARKKKKNATLPILEAK